MSTLQKTIEQQLQEHVWAIYLRLFKIYRQGTLEQNLECYCYGWSELDNNAEFYDYQAPAAGIKFTRKTINYLDAVDNLYRLILFLERHKEDWVKEHQVTILKIKSLIYEVKDYSLAVPPELGQFFREQAEAFNGRVKNKEVERFADGLKSEISAGRELDDARARVIKVQIIAALCGVNYLYRSHIHKNCQSALDIIENIETYVKTELPRQHQNERESFGLIGLTMYLKGRLLSATGDYDNAQRAFAESNDAYVARLDQKNDFYKKRYITEEEYQEKKAITLRRAALVSALGVGYLAFVNSRISKALAALRVSRAALKQNVGAVYEAYTDVLFFSCRRAEGSSDRQTIEEVIQGLEASLATLSELLPDSHYRHRAGIELAIALHYRAKFEQKTGKRAFDDCIRALRLLQAAIEHSGNVEEGRTKNHRLLTEALFVRSYVRRSLPDIEAEDVPSNLSKAEQDARKSVKEASGNSRMECEARIALGSVQYDQAKYNKSINNEAEFHRKLNLAQNSFREALTRNDGKNVRIEAVCYLKLSKLSLLDPGSVALAHDYFKKWREIEKRVEHAFCHYTAQEISRRLNEGGPLLIINTEASLNYFEWEKKLLMHLINTMLIKLSERTREGQYNEKTLHGLIVKDLMQKLGFKKFKAYELIKEHKLVEELQRRNK
ncbi:MAG TPA: hypothetical protein VF131_11940 [Blastocatellia bacterium]|nr:hypothetical protein [Blastocatellia bacterium]